MELVTIKTLTPLVKSSPHSVVPMMLTISIMSVCLCRQKKGVGGHIAEYRVVPVRAMN